MNDSDRDFLGRFGDVLLDSLQAGAALELTRRYAPQDDRVFTQVPAGPAVPVGQPSSRSAPASSGSGDLLLLAAIAFVAWQFVT